MKTSESWDLIAPVGRPDVLRAATLLASQLAEVERYRVRLFVDDLAPLTAMDARVDPALWVQPQDAYELVRLNLAQATTPADNIVRLFRAKLPRKYMERAIYGHGERKLFKVKLLDQQASFVDTAPGTTNLRFIEATQGDHASAAGVIRERTSSAEIRARWKKNGKLLQATLDSLGLDGHIFSGALFVCCWGAAIADWKDFLTSLDEVSQQKIILLVGADDGAPQVQGIATEGKVKMLRLPAMSWKQRDELVWLSDYVLTGHDDMAHRAMESGVPLLWLPDVPPKAKDDHHLVEWYSQGADPLIRRCLRELIRDLGTRASTSNALKDYFHNQAQVEILAANVAKRIARAPLMSRILPVLTPMPAAISEKWPLQHKTTIPASLPARD